jgi:hypothetical protein
MTSSRQKAPSPEATGAPKRHGVQISASAHERLGRLATETGLSRVQVAEFLIERGSLREHLRVIRAAKLTPRPTGRKKISIFSR